MRCCCNRIRFSASDSPRDWTNETLTKIRAIYGRHTINGERTSTVAQGIKLDTGVGSGHLPLAIYLDALQGKRDTAGLSPKYLEILRQAMSSSAPSLLLDPLRLKYREKCLEASDIEPWRQVLWRFATVGHIGKVNGPKAWQEPVTPVVSEHEMRVKLEAGKDLTLYLTTTDAGDGDTDDAVVWENPRIVATGRPDLPISHLPLLVKHLEAQRAKVIATAEETLDGRQDRG